MESPFFAPIDRDLPNGLSNDVKHVVSGTSAVMIKTTRCRKDARDVVPAAGIEAAAHGEGCALACHFNMGENWLDFKVQ